MPVECGTDAGNIEAARAGLATVGDDGAVDDHARGGGHIDPEELTAGDLGELSESARDHEGDPAAYAWSAERNSTRSSKGSITPATS